MQGFVASALASSLSAGGIETIGSYGTPFRRAVVPLAVAAVLGAGATGAVALPSIASSEPHGPNSVGFRGFAAEWAMTREDRRDAAQAGMPAPAMAREGSRP